MKKFIPVLFITGIALSLSAVTLISPGWLRQTMLFLGVVSAITGMVFRIAELLKNQ